MLTKKNQFIIGYSLHQRPTDMRCLKPHLKTTGIPSFSASKPAKSRP